MGRRPRKKPLNGTLSSSNNGKLPEVPAVLIPTVFLNPPVVPPIHDDAIVEKVLERAVTYAKENGLKGEITVSIPNKYDYGYELEVCDERGKTAFVRFTNEGEPRMWEMTSR